MNSNQILIGLIIICLVGSIILMFPKFFKIFGKLVLNATVGLGLIYGINMLIHAEELKVGLNYVTASVTAILGLPGVAMLYIVNLIV